MLPVSMHFSPGVRGWTVQDANDHVGQLLFPRRTGWTEPMVGMTGLDNLFPRCVGVDRVEREIRCQFIILARKDELTPDYAPGLRPR